MSSPQSTRLGKLLYEALAEPIGLVLNAPDPARARQQLYAARKRMSDPDLAVLQIRMSSFAEGNLVICKAGKVER